MHECCGSPKPATAPMIAHSFVPGEQPAMLPSPGAVPILAEADTTTAPSGTPFAPELRGLGSQHTKASQKTLPL
jgi:hypothetical protein